MSYGPNSLKIDLSALRRNLAQIKKILDPGTQVMGIVKSDAYGHGLIPIARTLEMEGVDCLGVSFIDEALKLRSAEIGLPIILLCGIENEEGAREVAIHELTPVIFDYRMAEILDKEASRLGKKIPVQVKIDTGMGRLGVPHAETGTFLERIISYENINIEALTSHLSSADEPDSGFTKTQIRNFKEAILKGQSLGLKLPLNSLANSAGIVAHKDSHFSMVRPGIMLYGGLPSPGFESKLRLDPVMKFCGKILQIRDFPDKTPLSYGRTYRTKGRQQIAVVSAGYGDGLLRSLSNKGRVLIKGKKAPIVGRVCMNMLLCDVSDIEEARPEDEALFLGVEDNEIITGDDLARWCDTISYEIFCSLGRCNNKEYINENKAE
jgi:alanine racemase